MNFVKLFYQNRDYSNLVCWMVVEMETPKKFDVLFPRPPTLPKIIIFNAEVFLVLLRCFLSLSLIKDILW